jgi:hypothetical protein
MIEFDKFLNANLGKLNKYEEEVKKELYKNTNNEEDSRSRTPGFVNPKKNENSSKLHKPLQQRNISQNKLDISKDKVKVRSNVSKPKIEMKDNMKNKDVNNMKSIKKDEINMNKTNKINNVKSQVKKEVTKLNTNEKVRPLKLELSSFKKNSEGTKKEREDLVKTEKKISNKIIFLDEPQLPKKSNLNNSSEESAEIKTKISVFFVSNLLTSISSKLQKQDEEIHNHNIKLSSEQNKALSGNYLNGVLGSIIIKFREETKLLNESGINDNILKRSSLNFVGNLFGDINTTLKKNDKIIESIKEVSDNKNDETLKNSSNDKKQHQIDNKRYSQKTSSLKNSTSNLSTSIRRNSQEDKKINYHTEKRVLIQNKNNSSIVQQNIIINNTYIENSPTIVLNFKKSISNKDSSVKNENTSVPDNNNPRKSIKEKNLQSVNEKKKSFFQQTQNSSNVNNKEYVEENKQSLNSFKRNSQKINSLVERNEKKNNDNKDQSRHRDLSSDAIISNKTMDRLNKSRSKFKETIVPKEKQSEDFQNKIDALSKMFVQNNRLSLSSEPCKEKVQKEEYDNSYIQTTLNKPMRIKAINKKTIQNFN